MGRVKSASHHSSTRARMKWVLVAAAVFCLYAPASAGPNVKIFERYTKANSGCKCWWDLTRDDCACCKYRHGGKEQAVQQCGHPMHNYCFKKIKDKNGKVVQKGCPGVPQNKYTLSTIGFACYWLPRNTKQCAWCAHGGYQCGPGARAGITSPRGNHCNTGRNKNYCDSVIGDCRHIPAACSSEAKCVPGKLFGKNTQLYRCKCNEGYTGNGVDCFDADGELAAAAAESVEMSLTLGSDYYVYPHMSGLFPTDPAVQQLIDSMAATSGQCVGGDKCEATFNNSSP